MWSRFLLYRLVDSSRCLFSALALAPSRKSLAALSEVEAHPVEITHIDKITINLIFMLSKFLSPYNV
ncbi:hypothetical protein ALT1644_40069 [Alteromonas macleodii]